MDEEENKLEYEQVEDIIPKPYNATSTNIPVLKDANPEFEEIPVEKIGIIEEIPYKEEDNGMESITNKQTADINSDLNNNILNQEASQLLTNNELSFNINNNEAIDNPVEEYDNSQFSGAIINPDLVKSPSSESVVDENFINPAVAAYSEAYKPLEESPKNIKKPVYNNQKKAINFNEILIWLLIFFLLFIFILFIPTIDKLINNLF